MDAEITQDGHQWIRKDLVDDMLQDQHDEHVKRMVRLRLLDMPLTHKDGTPAQLNDECIDYIMELFDWGYYFNEGTIK